MLVGSFAFFVSGSSRRISQADQGTGGVGMQRAGKAEIVCFGGCAALGQKSVCVPFLLLICDVAALS